MSELEPDKVQRIIEAVLISAEEPASPGKLLTLFDGLNGKDLRTAIDALNRRYEESELAFTIIEVAGGFQLSTRPQYSPWVRKFHDRSPVRLSHAALETLAIIAFKQPITRVDVDHIRGVNSGGVVRHLMELDLVRIVGRSEGVGKPHLFGTTRDFLVHFGLKSLADLPKRRELEELVAAQEKKSGEEGGAGEGLNGASAAGDEVEVAGDEVEVVGDEVEAVGDEVEAAGDEVEAVGDEAEERADFEHGDGAEVDGHPSGETSSAKADEAEI